MKPSKEANKLTRSSISTNYNSSAPRTRIGFGSKKGTSGPQDTGNNQGRKSTVGVVNKKAAPKGKDQEQKQVQEQRLVLDPTVKPFEEFTVDLKKNQKSKQTSDLNKVGPKKELFIKIGDKEGTQQITTQEKNIQPSSSQTFMVYKHQKGSKSFLVSPNNAQYTTKPSGLASSLNTSFDLNGFSFVAEEASIDVPPLQRHNSSKKVPQILDNSLEFADIEEHSMEDSASQSDTAERQMQAKRGTSNHILVFKNPREKLNGILESPIHQRRKSFDDSVFIEAERKMSLHSLEESPPEESRVSKLTVTTTKPLMKKINTMSMQYESSKQVKSVTRPHKNNLHHLSLMPVTESQEFFKPSSNSRAFVHGSPKKVQTSKASSNFLRDNKSQDVDLFSNEDQKEVSGFTSMFKNLLPKTELMDYEVFSDGPFQRQGPRTTKNTNYAKEKTLEEKLIDKQKQLEEEREKTFDALRVAEGLKQENFHLRKLVNMLIVQL